MNTALAFSCTSTRAGEGGRESRDYGIFLLFICLGGSRTSTSTQVKPEDLPPIQPEVQGKQASTSTSVGTQVKPEDFHGKPPPS